MLNAIKGCDIVDIPCADIRSDDLIGFAKELSAGRTPQTVATRTSWLYFGSARGYARDPQAMKNAFVVTTNLGLTGKSRAKHFLSVLRRTAVHDAGWAEASIMNRVLSNDLRERAVVAVSSRRELPLRRALMPLFPA
ncbi:hypothetical protein JDN40_03445 [Rhodomicrobium vannielii ATCC 17100]|uniref:hypothetical protein n=1 Tax=Rhodomicrobium vannielii TaxID=1069 RepID=UPI001919A56F|nr:hypothetical protein [Rhodomicrobium vannielii]MBJ7533165.1 hypothetical protein [Rhodomicrobium vannielii ATCC 17100]